MWILGSGHWEQWNLRLSGERIWKENKDKIVKLLGGNLGDNGIASAKGGGSGTRRGTSSKCSWELKKEWSSKTCSFD